MKIERLEKFPNPINMEDGDQFSLSVNGEVDHTVKITGLRVISCWALVRVGNSLGYFVGDDNLEQDLKCPDCGSPERDLTTPKELQ